MTTNCQWCQSRLEAYFAEELSPQDQELFQAHLHSCIECTRAVQDLRSLDPMVRQVLQRRLAQARSAGRWNSRPRVLRLTLAGSAIALAAVLGIALLPLRPQVSPTAAIVQAPDIAPPAPDAAVANPNEKVNPAANPQLGKPGEGTSAPLALQPGLDARPAGGPEFAIIDAAGQASTLETYRGHVLLFGVISSDQKEATANLQDLYLSFGSDPKVRILGVADHRDDRIEGATFPIRFNRASKLFGLQKGEFLVVDSTGSTKLRGSLANAADLARARTELGLLTK